MYKNCNRKVHSSLKTTVLDKRYFFQGLQLELLQLDSFSLTLLFQNLITLERLHGNSTRTVN